ncbi:MAG: hypothetical protein QM564_11400 [Bergeyella sp.]
MLVQSPSVILKTDFRNWKISGNLQLCEIIAEDNFKVREFLIKKSAESEIECTGGCTALLIPLYGLMEINGKTISANETLTLKNTENKILTIKNILEEDSDILMIEIKEKQEPFCENHSEISILRNALSRISGNTEAPNYIGIFDGREELQYQLENPDNKIFAMVLNGAFEIQNRLLENRDAVVLWEINELEFEALSENALIIFFEIQK